MSLGAWMACFPCWLLFRANDWKGLEDRWAGRSDAVKEFPYLEELFRREVRLLWQQLRENLI